MRRGFRRTRLPSTLRTVEGHICIAGQELFAADTAEEALALARTAHPEDDGRILRYIPRERVPRIYADLRRMVSLR